MKEKIIEGRKLECQVEEKSLGHFFFNYAEKYKERICQIDGTLNKTETYGSVKLRSRRVAIALQQRNLKSSDVVALCTANTLDTVIPMIATMYLGAKVATLEPSLSIRHTKHLLTLTTPKFTFVEEGSVALIEESLKETDFQTEIIVFGESASYANFADLDQPQEDEDSFKPLDVDVHETAIMFFSSGTTGLPKAICHSHYNILYLTNQIRQTGTHGTVMHFTSFYWITAVGLLTCSFRDGSSRVFSRNSTAEKIFQIFEKYKVETTFLAPILTYPLTRFEKADAYDTSSLKFIIVGGTPLPSSQYYKLKETFKTAVIAVGYGMTEIGLVAIFDRELDKEFLDKKVGSCGRPGPGLRLKVVDLDTNDLLGPNEKGEFCLISPSITTGYYNTNSSHILDKDGFLKTGDVGYYDEDGFVYLIERIKEMFKYQSWHIIPSSIEGVLLEYPAIKEAVVFGIPHGEDGEVPAACLVLKDGSNASKEEINAFLAKRVADREKLRGGITFVEKLPKTPSGKLVRREIRDMVMKKLISEKTFSCVT